MTDSQQLPPESLAPNTTPVTTRLLAEWHEATLRVRAILVLYLSIGAWGGLYGGIALSREFHNAWAWAASFLILEPIGLACLLALVSIVFPNSAVTELLAGALSRARLALWLILSGLGGVILFVVC